MVLLDALFRLTLAVMGVLVLLAVPASAQAVAAGNASNYVPLGSSAINDVSVAWFIDIAKNEIVACAFPVPTGYPGPQFQPLNIKCGSALYAGPPTPPSPVAAGKNNR